MNITYYTTPDVDSYDHFWLFAENDHARRGIRVHRYASEYDPNVLPIAKRMLASAMQDAPSAHHDDTEGKS